MVCHNHVEDEKLLEILQFLFISFTRLERMKITRRVIFVIILKIEIVIYPYFLGLFEVYIVDVNFHENGSTL